MYQVYLLKHPTNITYIGITNNLEKRIRQHNKCIEGGAKFTTRHSPEWEIISFSNFMTKNEALKLEYKLKKYKGFKKRYEMFNLYFQ